MYKRIGDDSKERKLKKFEVKYFFDNLDIFKITYLQNVYTNLRLNEYLFSNVHFLTDKGNTIH